MPAPRASSSRCSGSTARAGCAGRSRARWTESAGVRACAPPGQAGGTLVDRAYPIESVPDVPAALALAGSWLRDELQLSPLAVGHRVVHGGPDYDRPVLVDQRCSRVWSVLRRSRRCISRTIWRRSARCAANFPALPQVACFDTAFHRGHGAVADHYAIPEPSTTRASGATAFTAFLRIYRRSACRRLRRRSRRGG